MPKSSKQQIIDDENKVISELKKNAKESIDGIGKNCKFSRQKVWRIIKRLEKDKTIWGYSSIVDDTKIGLKRYIILIKRSSKPITKDQINKITNREFRNAAIKIGIGVESSYFTHGSFDWITVITALGIKQIKQFINLIDKFFSEGYIDDIQIIEVIFPLEVNGISNPNAKEFGEFFF